MGFSVCKKIILNLFLMPYWFAMPLSARSEATKSVFLSVNNNENDYQLTEGLILFQADFLRRKQY
ncbi:hypothetical protein Bresa_03480|nr:hypothetical protein [Brenneria salicis ATCC 15712 = DSM 30166]